jgi:signal transduction histidine kinase
VNSGDGDFIAIVAHELRNPLGPLRNVAALLKKADLDAQAIRRLSEIIDRQVGSMTLLIDDLVSASCLTADRFRLRLAPTVMSDVLESALETACPIVVEREHALVVTVPAEPIALVADATRLSQVLHNLVVNAAKYTDPGGQIRIELRSEGGTAVVSVTDTGIGIAPAEIDSIFDLHAQVAAERSAGGRGIGLYVARTLVEAHGGTLLAMSQGLDRGSRFTVRLPCRFDSMATALTA